MRIPTFLTPISACGLAACISLLSGCGSTASSAPAATSADTTPAAKETPSEKTSGPAKQTDVTERAAPSSSPDDSNTGKDWPVFRGNALATGIAESTLPENLEVLWKFNSNTHGFEATVAIVD